MKIVVTTHEGESVTLSPGARAPGLGETVTLKTGGVHMKHLVRSVETIVDTRTGEAVAVNVGIGPFD
jgi:hypothetical protein